MSCWIGLFSSKAQFSIENRISFLTAFVLISNPIVQSHKHKHKHLPLLRAFLDFGGCSLKVKNQSIWLQSIIRDFFLAVASIYFRTHSSLDFSNHNESSNKFSLFQLVLHLYFTAFKPVKCKEKRSTAEASPLNTHTMVSRVHIRCEGRNIIHSRENELNCGSFNVLLRRAASDVQHYYYPLYVFKYNKINWFFM